jgi:uncharacterized protein (DUF924 family)
MSEALDTLASQVLEFWFGEHDGQSVPEHKADMWFRNGRDYDSIVREQFAHRLDPAAAGAFDEWAESAAGRLALIIILDQFPRHIHRDRARAFAFDAKAREHCLAGLSSEQDQSLSPIERTVFYLPLEHAEDLALQERSVAMYEALCANVSDNVVEQFEANLGYAAAHRDIIARFGHFPHRNHLIGRPLTAAHKAFLKEPNSSF